ncbi:hypothetical protein HYU22_03445 [Candidatus Woesearchaeota archaeon]|nr:hypothetical protein [Candidatus Woesearchaeota archaeon]
MSLENLIQYGKAGLGVVSTVAGINADIGSHQSRVIMEEALYRTLETVTPEKMLQAKESLHAYIINNNSGISDAAFHTGLVIVGTALVASGIYNLVKNYRKETSE